MRSFTVENLPDLDEVVLATLEYLSSAQLPDFNVLAYKQPLVVGSVNALRTGSIIFKDTNAVFADEGNYHSKMKSEGIDAVYIFSASGGKHSVEITQAARSTGLPVFLVTNNPDAKAAEFVTPEKVLLFPRIREPYTYNTSTYMSMIMGATRENATTILDFITTELSNIDYDLFNSATAFTLITPTSSSLLNGMFVTKFDELFGPKILGRSFTEEEIKHAKTIVEDSGECFISFGSVNEILGSENNRVTIPIPQNYDSAAVMAIGYYIIGQIQKRKPSYFKDNIVRYTKMLSDTLGWNIQPIVE